MSTNTLPIVGMFYRPPAKAILENLPVGTSLYIIAEPDNPYDPNAIAVWINSEDIPETTQQRLEPLLPNFGKTLEELMTTESWHLGYIPKEMAAKIKAAGILDSAPLMCTFAVNAQGAPRVRCETSFDI